MEKHILLGLLIPVFFFAFAGMAKSLVKNQWVWSNFYLGIDISLAALANGIVNIVDGVHQSEKVLTPNLQLGSQMYYTSICIVAAVGALFGTMGLHQRFDVPCDEPGNRRWKRGILLGVVSNLFGVAVLAMFIFMKLRGTI
jgi:hypothetical protein